MTIRYLFSCIFLCLFGNSLSAQQDYDKVKFGQIDASELQLMEAPGDSTAEAYVLYDKLEVQLMATGEGPEFQELHHRRVKLLTESSFDRADIEILYNRKNQSIVKMHAAIHFPDGEIRKLSRKDFIREKYDDDTETLKFTFPGVRPGCIIEYMYTKNDANVVVPTRYFFQENIPVRHAEYRSLIPYYFNYISLSNGLNKYAINEVTSTNAIYAGKMITHAKVRWVMKDLPAYIQQPYVNNFSDYIPQVRLQLKSFTPPTGEVQRFYTNWEKTTKDLDDRIDFGRAWRVKSNGNKVFKKIEPLLAGKTTEREKAQVIYDFIASTITWDGNYRITSDSPSDKVYDNATGSSGEMSLMLLNVLNHAEIKARPLLVPLRNRGGPMEFYPLISQFDHLMVLATLDGEEVILDPGSINRPMGLPRTRALNHRAFVADTDNPHWMDIEVPKSYQTVMANVVLNDDGAAEVSLQSRFKGYYALNGRRQIKDMEEDGDFPLMEDILELFPEADLIGHEVKEEEAKSGPLSFTLNAKVPMGQPVDDYLYLQPILFPVLDKGLADVEERLYPVDFTYPWHQRYICNITIPEGYVVEEIPESIRMVSEDRTVICTFAINYKVAEQLTLNFSVSVTKTVFKSNEYYALREIFRRIIELQETTLVLKRAN